MKFFNVFRENFNAKVFLRFLVLIVAISLSFSIAFIRHQAKALSDSLIGEGLSLAEISSFNSRLGVFSENPAFLEDTLQGLMKHEGLWSCDILSLDGKVIGRKGNPWEATSETAKIIDTLTESKKAYYLEKTDSFVFWEPVVSEAAYGSEESLFYGAEGPPDEAVIGFLRLELGKGQIHRSFRQLVLKSILLFLSFLLVGSGIAFLLSKRVTTPLKELSKGAREIGSGNLDAQVEITASDEIGDLAMTFNEMAKQLRDREAERKRLMEQLNQSQRLEAIGIFAGGIAHDFNNILAIIQSNVDLAKVKAPEYLDAYMERSLEATKRGSELIERLLHFTSEIEIHKDEVDMEKTVRDAGTLLENTLDGRINQTVEVEPELWRAEGDPGQLYQVIMNLFTNARDAIRERLEENKEKSARESYNIRISLKNVSVSPEHCKKNPQAMEGKYVLLSVKDDGCGMDMQTLSHIFEPFFTTKDSVKGTGLGLSAVYGIVKHHKGWIEVQTEKGKGTEFFVYLPKFTEGKAMAQLAKAEEKKYVVGTGTILLVDDEEHIIAALRENLEDLGYEVLVAADGNAAKEILGKMGEEIDLVVLDFIMPGITGLDVLQYIRELGLKTEIIIYSGKDLSQYVHVLEGVEVVRKPCNMDSFMERVGSLLGRKGRPMKSELKRVKLYSVREKTVPYNETILDSTTVYKLFRNIASEPRETFIVLLVDAKNRIIGYDTLSTGTTDKAVVYPKEVVRLALVANAVSVFLIHNHPSGDLVPSDHDVIITAAITEACEVMDIKVLDHIIVSGQGYLSFSQEGLL